MGDQGIMFGYASDETEVCMPLTILIATRLGKKLTDVRKDGSLWWLRPDGKTQVTIEYKQNDDGSVEPLKIHTVVISTQHAEPSKAVRSKECEGYEGPEMTAPTMELMNKRIEQDVIVKCLEEIKLKNGKPAVSLYGDHTHLHINPSGKFIIGGPQADAGLTGRKIIIDTYGGWGAHGGGAFSGKDPTKVDRSAAYICRQMAKSIVKSGLSKVACETATKDNMVMVAGEITTEAKLNYEEIVRGVVKKIGFDSYVDDMSSVDSKGISDKTCEVIVRINKQSPDIAGGVHVGKDDMDLGAGDQGIMFGYASDETEDAMPLTHSMATSLGYKLTEVRKNGKLWWLRPDGKTQVTIEYLQKEDGSVEPQKIHTVVISTQHAEPLKAVRSKECAGYTGPG